MDKVKTFIWGAACFIVIWIVLAILSATIYTICGYQDLLLAHPYMWGGSISIFTFMLVGLAAKMTK